MRQYNLKAETEGEYMDCIIEICDSDDTKSIRSENWAYGDCGCWWAKKIDDQVFYSRSDVFTTERESATHVVIILK